jgi:hypothetical protein
MKIIKHGVVLASGYEVQGFKFHIGYIKIPYK